MKNFYNFINILKNFFELIKTNWLSIILLISLILTICFICLIISMIKSVNNIDNIICSQAHVENESFRQNKINVNNEKNTEATSSVDVSEVFHV